MSNDLIVVRQLPVIEDQLRSVRDTIQARVDAVLNMDCTEDTYKEVKKARAELNAQYRALEERRKEVKKQVEAPYKRFEEVYKAYAGDFFTKADKTLAQKIAAVEGGLREKKADKIRAFFTEYRESLSIPADLAPYERAGIAVTLSASEKSPKTQAQAFLDRVKEDLELIATQEHSDEILVEYRRTLNAAQAVKAVTNRHAEIERQRKAREEAAAAAERRQAAEAAVMRAAEPAQPDETPVQPPVAVPVAAPAAEAPTAHPTKTFNTAFRVYGTLEQMKALKKFLNDGGYTYEQL